MVFYSDLHKYLDELPMNFKSRKNKSLHLAHSESGYLCCFKTNLNPATTEANNIVPFAKKATKEVVTETVEQTAVKAGRVAGAVAGKVLGPVGLAYDVLGNAEPTAIGTFGTAPENTFNFASNPAKTLTMALNSAGELRLELNGTVPLPEQYSSINLAPDVNIGVADGKYTLYKQGETIKLALGDEISKKANDVLEIKTGEKTIEIKTPVGHNPNKVSRTELAGGKRETPSLQEQQQELGKQEAIESLNKSNTGSRAGVLGKVFGFLGGDKAGPVANDEEEIENPFKAGTRFQDPIAGSELIVTEPTEDGRAFKLGSVQGGFTEAMGAGKLSKTMIGWPHFAGNVEQVLKNYQNGVRQFILKEGGKAYEITNVVKEPDGYISVIGPDGQVDTSQNPDRPTDCIILSRINCPKASRSHFDKLINGYPIRANETQNLPWGERLSLHTLPNQQSAVKFEPIDSSPATIIRAETSDKIEIGAGKAKFGILKEGDQLFLPSRNNTTYTLTKDPSGNFLLKRN